MRGARPLFSELLNEPFGVGREVARVVGDKEGGATQVPNGFSLCKLHHAAFDTYFVGVRPDRIIEVRRDILEEQDGPVFVILNCDGPVQQPNCGQTIIGYPSYGYLPT